MTRQQVVAAAMLRVQQNSAKMAKDPLAKAKILVQLAKWRVEEKRRKTS